MGKTAQSKTSAKSGAKRHALLQKKPDIETGVTKNGVHRLAKRAGAPRISATVTGDSREIVEVFLTNVLRKANAYRNKRKTLKPIDVVAALRFLGYPIYTVEDTK